jgi:hypothetical protein
MKHLATIIFILTILACNETNSNPSANISGSFPEKRTSELTSSLDSLYLPIPGNGLKHIQPQQGFSNYFGLFKELLQQFKYVKLPFELDGLVVDKTNEEWEKSQALDKRFYRFLMDRKDFQMAKSVVNPMEEFEDFYKVYPIVKLEEQDFYNTLIYLVRYLDGNGQQDFFYLTTFNSNGVFLSGVEIGALQATGQTYIKTAQISKDHIIKVHYADYNEKIDDWVKTRESQYFMDNTGQVYGQYEDKIIGQSKSDDSGTNASFIKMSDFQNYFLSLQREVRSNSPNGILNYITFPHLRVSYEEHFQDIKTKEEFLSQYDIIFNESLRKKIARQDFSGLVFNGDQIGLADGSIWFKRLGRDNDGKLVVAITVN